VRKRLTWNERGFGSRPDVRSAGLFYSLPNYLKHSMTVKLRGRKAERKRESKRRERGQEKRERERERERERGREGGRERERARERERGRERERERAHLVLVDGTHFPQTSIALASAPNFDEAPIVSHLIIRKTALRPDWFYTEQRHNSPRQRALEPTIRILVNLTCCSTAIELANHLAFLRIIYFTSHQFKVFTIYPLYRNMMLIYNCNFL